MRNIIFLILLVSCDNAKSGFEQVEFINPINADKIQSIKTVDLLKELSWEELERYSEEHGFFIHSDESGDLMTSYKYYGRDHEEYIEIYSYNGRVVEYKTLISRNKKQNEIHYFDKQLWIDYVDQVLPNIPKEFRLDLNEPREIIKPYYEFLGINTTDEYGWICEYSTIGKLTSKRKAILFLVKYEKMELLRKLVKYPDIQIQTYAADALLYLDYKKQEEISEFRKEMKYYEPDISETELEEHYYFKELKQGLMTDKDIKRIEELRGSNKIVNTCGNSGSYKIYEKTTNNLLSEKMIPEIVKQYDHLLEYIEY